MAVIISNKALKLKLNPTTSQYSQFLKSFGCERFVYNFNAKILRTKKKRESSLPSLKNILQIVEKIGLKKKLIA